MVPFPMFWGPVSTLWQHKLYVLFLSMCSKDIHTLLLQWKLWFKRQYMVIGKETFSLALLVFIAQNTRRCGYRWRPFWVNCCCCSMKLQQGWSDWMLGKGSSLRVFGHRNRFLREVVTASSLLEFQRYLGNALRQRFNF